MPPDYRPFTMSMYPKKEDLLADKAAYFEKIVHERDAEIAQLRAQIKALTTVSPTDDRFVVMTPFDIYIENATKSNGALIHEQYINKSDLSTAVTRAKQLTRYGQPLICKVSVVGSIEDAEKLLQESEVSPSS